MSAEILDYAQPVVPRRRWPVILAALIALLGCPLAAVLGAVVGLGDGAIDSCLAWNIPGDCILWGSTWGVPGGLAFAIVAAESKRYPIALSAGGCAAVGLFSGGLLSIFSQLI